MLTVYISFILMQIDKKTKRIYKIQEQPFSTRPILTLTIQSTSKRPKFYKLQTNKEISNEKSLL
jgi:hypothetical protein